MKFSKLLGCPAVASRDHKVCLAAKHAERRGSPRLHKLADTDAEGVVLSPLNRLYFNDRSTIVVLKSTSRTTPRNLASWLDQEFRLRRHCIMFTLTCAESRVVTQATSQTSPLPTERPLFPSPSSAISSGRPCRPLPAWFSGV